MLWWGRGEGILKLMTMYKTEYKKEGLCNRCGLKLRGKQKRWCSLNCSRLGLKREWKQRNPKIVKRHKRNYGKKLSDKIAKKLRTNKSCHNCKSVNTLQVHHIKPIAKGGGHDEYNLMILCAKCHRLWEKRMRGFWR